LAYPENSISKFFLAFSPPILSSRRATFRQSIEPLERHMSLIKRSDVKNHLSTRTGDTTVPVQAAVDSGASGNTSDGIRKATENAVFASPGGSVTDELVSSGSGAGNPKA
jgi:hypothetical protein